MKPELSQRHSCDVFHLVIHFHVKENKLRWMPRLQGHHDRVCQFFVSSQYTPCQQRVQYISVVLNKTPVIQSMTPILWFEQWILFIIMKGNYHPKVSNLTLKAFRNPLYVGECPVPHNTAIHFECANIPTAADKLTCISSFFSSTRMHM